MKENKIVIIAEDQCEDQELLKMAIKKIDSSSDFLFVENGEQLLNYLTHDGMFSDEKKFPMPSLIILDLNMPIMDGRTVLKNIKGSDIYKHIPIIIFSQSSTGKDIELSYLLGCNSYITKPNSFDDLVQLFDSINKFWLKTAELPI